MLQSVNHHSRHVAVLVHERLLDDDGDVNRRTVTDSVSDHVETLYRQFQHEAHKTREYRRLGGNGQQHAAEC